MAQLSTTMSHAHRATAFHYSISARFGWSGLNLLPQTDLLDFKPLFSVTALLLDGRLWWCVGRIVHLHISHGDLRMYAPPRQRKKRSEADSFVEWKVKTAETVSTRSQMTETPGKRWKSGTPSGQLLGFFG